MKQCLLQVGLIFLLLLSLGCQKPAQETVIPSNQKYQLELLFEHEGIKVYRFYDGRTIYFTDARGVTEWSVYRSAGTAGYFENTRVETVK